MRICAILFALALSGYGYCVQAAPSFWQAARQLDGDWRGADFVLRVDARRAQASLDPVHPFAWEHFLIKEVSEDEIVFSVGAELFEARVDSDTLTLTGTSFRGTRVLYREANLRGTTSE